MKRRLRLSVWIAGAALLVLVLVRLALPRALAAYATRVLNETEEYDGEIKAVDLSLWRAAFSVDDIVVNSATGESAVPFFRVDSVNVSLSWPHLLRGRVFGDVDVIRPQIEFVAGLLPEQRPDITWQQRARELLPFRIRRLTIREGEVHLLNHRALPPIDIALDRLNITARNISNAPRGRTALLEARGVLQNSGECVLSVAADPLAKRYTFDLNLSVQGLDLTRLNAALREFAGLDVQSGTADIFIECASDDGRFEGYVKPLFDNLNVFQWGEKTEKPLQSAWEAVAGAAAELFENQPEEQLATRIPFKGEIKATDIGIATAVAVMLHNAFVQALLPRLEGSISIRDVRKGK